MSIRRLLFCFSGIAVCTWIATGADKSVQLVRSAGTDSLDPVVDRTHGFVKWSHGAFLYVDPSINTLPPSFSTLDRDGHLIASATLSIPEAERFWFSDYDRRPDGSIVFSGGAYSKDGQAAPFVAWISAGGQTERVVRTAPYYPYRLSIAPDGTVWTLGFEMINHNSKAAGLNPNAGVLRHFDIQGKLVASAMPQWQFRTQSQRVRLSLCQLVATQDRLGWYSSSFKGEDQYVEISTSTLALKSFPGLPQRVSTGETVEGFTLTPDGEVSVSTEDHTPGYRTAYWLDRATSQWLPLKTPAIGGFSFAPHLIGSDGENLVFQYGHSAVFLSVSH